MIDDKTFEAVLKAKMPDGCTVEEYLEDAIPPEVDMIALGIPCGGYGISDIRAEVHQSFYHMLINVIVNAANKEAQND